MNLTFPHRHPLARPSGSPIGGLLGAVLLVCAVGTAAAQTPRAAPATDTAASAAGRTSAQSQTGKTAVSAADRKFMETAARDGMAEVEMGQVVQQRAADGQAKAFAERMVADHGKANAELAQLAAAKGVTLPTGPDSAHQREAAAMGKMSGADVDRAYMKRMVDEHRKDVSAFKKFSGQTKDPELKDFATRTLVTLEAHLAMARSAQPSAGAGLQGQGGQTAGGLRAGSAMPAASAAMR